MNTNKLVRLNCLFEKALVNNVKLIEKRELAELYNEFINDGRDDLRPNIVSFPSGDRRSVS